MLRPSILACALLALGPIACAAASLPDPTAPASPPTNSSWALQLPGVSHHFQPPSGLLKVKAWNERNTGIGLEYRRRWDGDVWVKGTVGILLDSTDTWGTYTGAALQRRVVDSTFSVDAGAGAFIFYRGFESGKKGWLPAVLPVISVEHQPSGVGANLTFVPKFKAGSLNSPAFTFVQAFWRF